MSVSRALLALCLLAFAGCAQPEVPRDNFHRLMVSDPQPRASAPLLPGTLEVPRPTADGLTSERPMVYSFHDQPQLLRQYSYHYWNDVPSAILQEQLVHYLRASRVAATVVTPELRQRPNFELVGRIKRFEQVIGPPNDVVVEVEFGLARAEDDKLLLLKTYHSEKTSRDDTPAAAAQAINAAVGDVLQRLVDDLAALKVR